MQYLHNYTGYRNSVNEGVKNWLATFLVLANLGLAPLNLKSAPKAEQKEFVDSLSQDKIDAALFVDFLSKHGAPTNGLTAAWSQFTESNPQVQSKLGDVEKYVQQDGKKYIFDKQYTHHDFSHVDIHNFKPDNWMTDMAGFVPENQQPNINNLIDQYEKKTSVEIAIVTVESLEGEPIEDYAADVWKMVGGIGKKYEDNGVLIVLSKKDRKWRIHTGYGIGEYLTDIQCSRIGNEIITAHFKKGEFYDGIYDAVKEIEDEIGQDNIVMKQQFSKDKAYHDKIHQEEVLATIGEYLFAGLILALIGGGIFLLRKRSQRRKAEAAAEKKRLEELHTNIDQIIELIEKLKTSAPLSADLKSGSLMAAYEQVKKAIQSIKDSDSELGVDKYSNENLATLKKLYHSLDAAIKNYGSSKRKVQDNLEQINRISQIKSSAYTAVDRAAKAADKIKQLGYQSGTVPSKSDVDAFDPMMLAITALLAVDIDQAISKLSEYKGNISDVQTKAGNVETKLSNIESTISRVQGWQGEVQSAMKQMVPLADNTEKSKADQLVDDFKKKVAGSKDWVALSGELDKATGYITGVTHKYQEIARKKREAEEKKRRDDEEEERRKRRRREEEEEESRRSSYSSSSSWSSSSSSDSSSFGGFGGGDSGGGGASGGW